MAGDWASLIAEEVRELAQREADEGAQPEGVFKEVSSTEQAEFEGPEKEPGQAFSEPCVSGGGDQILSALRERAAKPLSNPYIGLKPCPTGGYEFRAGHSTKFPKIQQQDGETDLQAAFRAASELRNAGLKHFGDGSRFVAAQEAVDSWGQGILALHRLRNLSARAVAQDDENARLLLEGSQPVELVDALEVVLRLNLAQALIKLKQFENAVCQCQGALELDPKNVKALWRKAKAVWALRCPGEAREALDEFLKVDPGNPAARAMLLEIETEELKRQAKRVGPNFGFRKSPKPREETNVGLEVLTPAPAETSKPLFFCCRRKRKHS